MKKKANTYLIQTSHNIRHIYAMTFRTASGKSRDSKYRDFTTRIFKNLVYENLTPQFSL